VSFFIELCGNAAPDVRCRSPSFNLDFSKKFRLEETTWYITRPEKKRNDEYRNSLRKGYKRGIENNLLKIYIVRF